jgi:hypothetical protein
LWIKIAAVKSKLAMIKTMEIAIIGALNRGTSTVTTRIVPYDQPDTDGRQMKLTTS